MFVIQYTFCQGREREREKEKREREREREKERKRGGEIYRKRLFENVSGTSENSSFVVSNAPQASVSHFHRPGLHLHRQGGEAFPGRFGETEPCPCCGVLPISGLLAVFFMGVLATVGEARPSPLLTSFDSGPYSCPLQTFD